MTDLQQNYFQITHWDETPFIENISGLKQSHAKITQEYHGDIIGHSELQYLMCYLPNGNANFVGFETIDGTFKGKKGQLVLQHKGEFNQGIASSEFTIVVATNELENISGRGSFKSGESGLANYVLNIDDQ